MWDGRIAHPAVFLQVGRLSCFCRSVKYLEVGVQIAFVVTLGLIPRIIIALVAFCISHDFHPPCSRNFYTSMQLPIAFPERRPKLKIFQQETGMFSIHSSLQLLYSYLQRAHTLVLIRCVHFLWPCIFNRALTVHWHAVW